MVITLVAPDPPRFCASPSVFRFTCRSPACPRICSTTSQICPTPVAPTGCPLDFSPPLAMQTRAASQTKRTALALRNEAQVFDRKDLGNSEAVVYFGELDIGRLNTGHLVSFLRRCFHRAQSCDVVLL